MKQRTKKRTYRKIKRTHGKKTRGRNTRGNKTHGNKTRGNKTHRKKSGIIQHTQYGGSPWAWLIFASIMGLRIEYVDEDEMGHKRIKRLILPGGVIYEFLNWLAGLIPPSIGTTKESKKMIMSEDLREELKDGNFQKWFLQFLSLKYGNKYEAAGINYNNTALPPRKKSILTRQRIRNLNREDSVLKKKKKKKARAQKHKDLIAEASRGHSKQSRKKRQGGQNRRKSIGKAERAQKKKATYVTHSKGVRSPAPSRSARTDTSSTATPARTPTPPPRAPPPAENPEAPPTAPPLEVPPGWEAKMTHDGKPYYQDHASKTTHWSPPAAAPRRPG